MKRVLALIFAGVFLLSLAACSPDTPTTDTGSGSVSSDPVGGTVSDTDSGSTSENSSTDSSNSNTSETGEITLNVFDPTLDHKVIMDDSSKTILVVDFDKGSSPAEWSMDNAVIWEWSTDMAKGFGMQGKNINIDSAKYRYSEYYKKDVIIFCGSSGWVGIIDYQTKDLLFEHQPGNGPHAVEILPNGDLVVARSGNGNGNGDVLYYPIASGASAPSDEKVKLDSAHGICYDPKNKVLWALGDKEIVALRVMGDGVSAKLTKINGMGVNLSQGGGHVLAPAYGNPGKYWVSTGKKVWVYDSENQSISSGALRAPKYSGASVKGMAYFADGTMVQTAHDQGGTGTYRSSQLKIMYLAESSGKVTQAVVKSVMIPHRAGSQTYKVHVFTKDYQ